MLISGLQSLGNQSSQRISLRIHHKEYRGNRLYQGCNSLSDDWSVYVAYRMGLPMKSCHL